ncbi:uncharacterized protein K460DRAFT_283940 [Cucurbitaria berberidis CBS 394.84]|uniref:Uncharacterized protein n=1 Tax=Cucurbitaria berberidis CBS 394.84 TaxID=1168544 RepID=A0A9P4GIM5_9PLEO|nr:uncharacterized protein K460DRAFT_283940 [Cucurbitaria berberidis CBS 394.84]KAF1846106.1 hypothetical protein K460DRAFT_283940 [Cucurbitaria berberidis CBS 394.84]
MFSKSRWRTKPSPNEQTPAQKAQLNDDDVNDFLKPSTEKAQQQKAAAAAFLASANRPRIDVARAQRWPGAQDVLNAAVAAEGRSPGRGGLKTGTRKPGLAVNFVRTVPEIIGHGGDDCDELVVDVSRRKTSSNGAPDVEKLQQQGHQDDTSLGTRSNGIGRTISQAEQRNNLTRTLTSHGELSPELGQRLQMGQINAYVNPPPPPPQRLGPMGLGERPRVVERAPTGLDGQVDPTVQPNIEEDDGFRPKPFKRTQTGLHDQAAAHSENEPAPAIPNIPHLPELKMGDDSPLDDQAMLVERYLRGEPAEPNSFAARVKMRETEGRALHEAAQRAASGSKRDSDASSVQSAEQFRVTTPPSSSAPFAGRTPPQAPPVDTVRGSPLRALEADDPHRSRRRGPSPARPSSRASSQHTTTSPARASPAIRSEPFSSLSAQQTPSTMEKPPFSTASQNSTLPPPSPFEKGASYFPPSHTQHPPSSAISPGGQLPMRSRPDASAKPSQPLGRSDTKMQGESAYDDFAERVTHMKGIFQLTAQLGGSIYDYSPLQWVRVATWWFLRGRAGMETLIRSRPRIAEEQPERLAQPHVDLAKVLWIVTEVLPNHPGLRKYGPQGPDVQAELARQAGDAASAEAYEIQNAITHYLKLLVGSMVKHQSMPPTQALIQGQDQSIWEEYPAFAPDAASVLVSGLPPMTTQGAPQRQFSLSQYIPLADTKNEFCYFRMFVKASLSTDDPNTDRVPMSTVISVLRSKDEYQTKLAICSQTNLINIIVSNSEGGVTWNDVNWKKQSQQISVQLRHGFTLNIQLSEGDWRSLWAIVEHTNRVESDLRERRDERFACKLYLREAAYKDPANPSAFPPERVPGCKLMVFRRIERSSEGTGKRKLHRGYRMALVTGQQNKQVSLVNHELGTKQEPMNFEYVTEPDQAPAMRLHFREEGPDKKPRYCTVHLVFQETNDRNHLFGTFTSMNMAEGEMTFAQVPLKAFHIESADQAEGFSQQSSRLFEKLQWQEAKVMNEDPEATGLESAPTVMSESLRIVCRHSAGIVSDRLNLGPGELLVRLPVDGAAELTLLREAQQDMAIAIDGSRTERGIPEALAELLRTLTTASTIRRLTFNSFKDLHDFQLAVTGFDVKFDGTASTFSISRRRMVVPIYKQWTATSIRLQIVQQDNIVQLLAFFEDFSHADAMNFQLRTMDVFEKTDKGSKFGLKLVDAKFALPVEERRGEGKMQKAEGRLTGWSGVKRRFVCLDEVEYPGEHDDILIQFDSAEIRDHFAAALPAATIEHKLFTVRRKI